jgi:hypothetical protein
MNFYFIFDRCISFLLSSRDEDNTTKLYLIGNIHIQCVDQIQLYKVGNSIDLQDALSQSNAKGLWLKKDWEKKVQQQPNAGWKERVEH